nr:unnamed protein product [Digitaria exilis]
MAVDPRQVVAGFLTLSMFVMLGNMIKHDHFSSSTELGLEVTGVEFNSMKLDDDAEMNNVNVGGLENLMDADEEVKPCWTKPSPKTQPSNGFVTFSLTMGPEYHISQITDAVVVARYLGATLVLPDIRGNELGNKRKFQHMYNVDKFIRNLDGVVEVIEELPDEDDILPADKKGEFLKSSNSDLARALDLEICSQSDVFIPAVPGLFYGHVTGRRIALGHTQILVPSQSSASTQASDFISTYISNKNHLAYKCYC